VSHAGISQTGSDSAGPGRGQSWLAYRPAAPPDSARRRREPEPVTVTQ
jgi:hypothetical protein